MFYYINILWKTFQQKIRCRNNSDVGVLKSESGLDTFYVVMFFFTFCLTAANKNSYTQEISFIKSTLQVLKLSSHKSFKSFETLQSFGFKFENWGRTHLEL